MFSFLFLLVSVSALWPFPCQRVDSIQKFDEILRQSYRGQSEALFTVKRNFKINVIDTSRPNPLLFHFSGPRGVGKSYLIQLLSEALFTSPGNDRECGQWTISLSQLNFERELTWKDLDKRVVAPIAKQLQAHPRSIITIDEAQLIHPTLLDCLKFELSENLHRRAPDLQVANAIIIVITTTGVPVPNWSQQTGNGLTKLKCPVASKPVNLGKIEEALEKAKNQEADLASHLKELLESEVQQEDRFIPVRFSPLSSCDEREILATQLRLLESHIRIALAEMREASDVKYDVKWIGSLLINEDVADKILAQIDRQFGALGIEAYFKQFLLPQVRPTASRLLTRSTYAHFIQTSMTPFLAKNSHVVLDDVEVTLLEDDSVLLDLNLYAPANSKK